MNCPKKVTFAYNVFTIRPSKKYEFVFFIGTDFGKNVVYHHLLTGRSSAVNGCRHNESSNSYLKTSQYFTIIIIQ